MTEATFPPRLLKISGATGRQLEAAAAIEGRQIKEVAEDAITAYLRTNHPDILEIPVESLRLAAVAQPA